MEIEERENTTHEPASSTWPWIPDPTNVPAPLLQRPLDTVSDWISSEELCDVCSRFSVDEERVILEKTRKSWERRVQYISFKHRTAQDLERVAGAAVRAGESCCPLCALIWKRMRDHFVYYFPSKWFNEQVTENEIQPGTSTYATWADWKEWQDQGKEVDAKVREMEFSRLMGQDEEVIELYGRSENLEIVHESSLYWPCVEGSQIPENPDYDGRSAYRKVTLYTLPDAPSAGQVDHHIPWRNLTQAAQYAASWARNCLQNHPLCPKSIESPLPRRLVDVGRYGSSDTPRIWINPSAISVSEGEAPPTPIMGSYVALSYCWGLEPFEVVNPQNLARMTEEIPVKRLPLTIQDAIEFTRVLGIRYLWVDSLCILQGASDEAKEDWNEESVKMQTIYHNALLTIGAAAGKNAYAGIRPTADPPEMPFCALPKGFGGTHISGQIYAGLQETALHEDHIHKRAWTFQERLLSARYVNLGDPKMYWYCKQVHLNQDRHWKADSYPKMPWQSGLINEVGYTDWQQIVDDYTSRSISRKEDRLIALSGVAKDLWLRGRERDEYLAGLWRSTIDRDIVWRGGIRAEDLVRRNQKDPSSPLSPAIPSWSWASQNKQVDWIPVHDRCSSLCAQFLGSHVVGDPDQFGHSVKGSIRFRGWIKKALVRVGIGSGNGDIIESESTPRPFGISWLDDRIDAEWQPICTSSGEQHLEVLCLEIHKNEVGLLLSPESPEGNRYRRVGMFFMHQEEDFPRGGCDIVELV